MERTNIVPYIGITDFTSPDQVKRILRVPTELKLDSKIDHVLGVGVMMSYKTLNDLPTKWSKAFPRKESIADIFIDSEQVYNVLHYADYDGQTTSECLRKAVLYGGPNLNAIQLDMPWPDLVMIRAALGSHESRPSLKIILQVGKRAMQEMGDDIEKVVQKIHEYYVEGCVNYVLLDRSGGKGEGMNAELLRSYYHAIRLRFFPEDLGIVVAGGLGPDTMFLLAPFLSPYYDDLSIDAQGKLRLSGNALDPIDWDMAADYYAAAIKFFRWF